MVGFRFSYWLGLLMITSIDAFASKLVSGEYCDLQMEEGILMMGKPIEMNETYSLKLYRKDMSEVFNEGNP